MLSGLVALALNGAELPAVARLTSPNLWKEWDARWTLPSQSPGPGEKLMLLLLFSSSLEKGQSLLNSFNSSLHPSLVSWNGWEPSLGPTGCHEAVVLFPVMSACFTSQTSPLPGPGMKKWNVIVGQVWLQYLGPITSQFVTAFGHKVVTSLRIAEPVSTYPHSLWVNISPLHERREHLEFGDWKQRETQTDFPPRC